VGWTATEVVSTESTGNSFFPSLAVDLAGNVHIAWHDATDYGGCGSDYDIFYKRYEVGVGWTATEVVSTESTADSRYPCLAVDFGGNVHVAWKDWTDYAGCGADADVLLGVGRTLTCSTRGMRLGWAGQLLRSSQRKALATLWILV